MCGRHAGQRGQRDEAAEARTEEEPVSIAKEHDDQVSKCRTRARLRDGLRNLRTGDRFRTDS